MDSLRETVRETLSTKFSDETVDKYEDVLYNAALKKSKATKMPKNKIYLELSYEKLGQIMVAKAKEERKAIIKEMIDGLDDEWESIFYAKQKENYKKLMDKSVAKPKTVKGVYHCKEKGCGSDEFFVWQRQTKSSDEGMSNFRQCARCSKRKRD
jgi:DNA-directed RNA polymerase subunit M/transcription elongation factor TFIIS